MKLNTDDMNKYYVLIGTVLFVLFSSCSNELKDSVEEDVSENGKAIVCKGIVQVDLDNYDGNSGKSSSTRGVADGWSEGDIIYMLLTSGGSTIPAKALYSNGEWTVSLTKAPVMNSEQKCLTYYFENPGKETGTTLSISDRTAIYEDNDGSYLFDGSSITITSQLSPKLGRIRFAGNKNSIIKVFGVSAPKGFDSSKGTFVYSTDVITDTVKSNGYTPYIYGYMSDSADPRLYVVTKASAFTKYCDERVLKTGKSGWLNIPTTESHFGWYEYLALKVCGYELKMLPVWYATASTPYLFLLSETEVTEGLYNSVTGSGSKTSLYPKVNINYVDSYSFAKNTMSALTGLSFSIPLIDEWKYAFGSNVYSGSAVIDEVAWYSGNSDGMKQMVGELNPNEYGLYDMSGNVAEWAESYYNNFFYYFPYCGGDFTTEIASCKNSYSVFQNVYSDYKDAFSYVGIRLCLKF